MGGLSHARTEKYPDELRERAVRLVFQIHRERAAKSRFTVRNYPG